MNRTKLTPKKKRDFLLDLQADANVTKACEKNSISRTTIYDLKKRDKKFAKAWAAAETLGINRLEDEARRRALDGWESPVYYKGELVGTEIKYSDLLLVTLLNAHLPEKYKNRQAHEITGAGGGPVDLRVTFKNHFGGGNGNGSGNGGEKEGNGQGNKS